MEIKRIERAYIVHDDDNVFGFFGPFKFLSNFEPCEIWFDGLKYTSTEAAYQAQKTTDITIHDEFTRMTPSESKRKGRMLKIRPDWDAVKYDVMCAVVFDKFYRNHHLRQMLLSTGNKQLTEANHWSDVYYGVCDGKGENILGKILMGVRDFWQIKNVGTVTKLF